MSQYSAKDRTMDEVKSIFNRFANLVDRDIKGVHIGCYSVALIGLTIAIRKVRPFSKFTRPRDIPNHFIKEGRELTGVVKRIDPAGAVLMVEHKPLLHIPIIRPGQLPVKISGVKVTGLGLNWLQTVVAGQQIKFVPVVKDGDSVQCQVLLVQKTKDKEELLNVGERLLKIGFGQTVEPTKLADGPSVLKYYKRLQVAENYALRKKMGLKYYIEPTKQSFQSLFENLNDLSRKFKKVDVKKTQEKKKIGSIAQLMAA